jgi:ParB/RepB/Spo0J family partition protein
MAVKFEVLHTRGTVYWFLPEDVRIDAHLNGRHLAPDITALKASILEHGQLQPVAVRNDAGTPVLVMGFSRWTAISEINEEKRKVGDENLLKLSCTYVNCNEQDGFIMNWQENRARNATSPLDDAHHFAQLERWGLSRKQIASRMKVSELTVDARLALITTTAEVQKAVSEGRLKVTAAVKLAKLSQAQQRWAVEKPGKVTKLALAEASGENIKPSAKIVRDAIEERRDDTTEEAMIRQFCELLLHFMDGESDTIDLAKTDLFPEESKA